MEADPPEAEHEDGEESVRGFCREEAQNRWTEHEPDAEEVCARTKEQPWAQRGVLSRKRDPRSHEGDDDQDERGNQTIQDPARMVRPSRMSAQYQLQSTR